MTLVVARQKGSIIAVVADTGISKQGVNLGPEQQLPKICILTPDIAVAFAGEPDLAVRYLNAFPRTPAPSYRSTVDYFAACQVDSEDSVDFLILFNRPSPKMVPIREGEPQAPVKGAWLGDQSAFEVFQHYASRPPLSNLTSAYEVPQLVTNAESEAHRKNETFSMLGTLRYVLIDSAVPSVFGSGVAANNVDGTFQFRSYAFKLDVRPANILVPPSFARRLAPEIVEIRNYAASCLVTKPDAPMQGVAYHYAHGKLTYMYSGQRGHALSNAKVFNDMNVEQFIAATRGEFGEWFGSVVLGVPPPASYGIPRHRWKISTRSPGAYRRPG